MRLPFAQITAVLLLIHTLLGCCWHHAHAASVGDSHVSAQLGFAFFACEHDCDRKTEDAEHSEHEPVCDDQVCSYILSKSAMLEHGISVAKLSVLDNPLTATFASSILQTAAPAISSSGLCASSMRLHLALGVLLI